MADGRVLYARKGDVHWLRYVGDIRYVIAPSIDAFVNAIFDHEPIKAFVVDLSAADSVDSTNLGELARIARRLGDMGADRPIMVSTVSELTDVLRSMALDEVFDLRTESIDAASADDSQAAILDLPHEPVRRGDLRQLMLATHRSLMEMSDDNRARFRDVVAMMEEQSARRFD